ncbi:MAG TPA: hypothetical protein VGN95_20755 [Pyrinomonadaceae bacterium]|nr:hypothetical protein [Pyrinomonadaceae bacterium]
MQQMHVISSMYRLIHSIYGNAQTGYEVRLTVAVAMFHRSYRTQSPIIYTHSQVALHIKSLLHKK